MSEKYTWARNKNQEVWGNGQFENKEDAIKQGRAELQHENDTFELENYEVFYIGKCQPYVPGSPDAELTLERLGDRMCDEFLPDMVEDFILDISIEDTRLLQEKLDNAWNEWLEETDNYPNLYKIADVEEIKVYPEQ